MLRQPFPWESGGPRRQAVDLEERPEVASKELEAAEALLAQSTYQGSDRGRVGAARGADWVFREMEKQGIQTTREAVRSRMNDARTRSANKKRR